MMMNAQCTIQYHVGVDDRIYYTLHRITLFVSSGLVGLPPDIPQISFSAALTIPVLEAGTIAFDKILVNDGHGYDPETGECRSLKIVIILQL